MFIVYFYITPMIISMLCWILIVFIEGPRPEYVKDLFYPMSFIPLVNILFPFMLLIGIIGLLITKIGNIKLR